MKTFFIMLSFVVFGVASSSCEERIRRQIWGPPPDFNPAESNDGNDFSSGPPSPRTGPPTFDRPMRNQNDFLFGRGDGFFERKQNDRRNRNQIDRGSNVNPNPNRRGSNENVDRRTTTQRPGVPVTTSPSTLHHAPQGCACPVTQQFNPVCGTDGNTYKNEGLLNCYRRCGTRVSQKRLGAC